MRFLVFGKSGCNACLQVKDKIKRYITKHNLDVELERFDIGTEDGLVESSMYDVQTVPTFVIEREDGTTKKWTNGVLYKDIDEELAK